MKLQVYDNNNNLLYNTSLDFNKNNLTDEETYFSINKALRYILRCQEGASILDHAQSIIKELDTYKKSNASTRPWHDYYRDK